MNKIRVAVADDHRIVRDGLTTIIGSEPDMEIVGEAGDGGEAIRLAREARPDVMVLDISMPDTSGIVAAAEIKRDVPAVGILMLTQHADHAYLVELLHAGISGYVLKKSSSGEMLRGIREIAGGRQYLDPAITTSVFKIVAANNGGKSDFRSTPLTDLESDILRRVARGYSNREIADQIKINVRTVEMHKASAVKKLNIQGRNEIVDYALLQGWFSETLQF